MTTTITGRIVRSGTVDRLRRSPLRIPVSAWRHRGLTRDDVLIASFPRSGNTWVRAILLELLTGEQHEATAFDTLAPIVGGQRNAPPLLPNGGRLVKSHEPYRRTAARAVYLIRDVRDVVPSYQRLGVGTGLPTPPFDEFLEDFVRGDAGGFGRWEDHVDSWLDAREAGADILVLTYEDLVADTLGVLRRIVDYLGVEVSDEQITAAMEHTRPDRMKERTQGLDAGIAATAVGKARPGGWRERYTSAQLASLAPTAPTMRRAGYAVTDDLQDA